MAKKKFKLFGLGGIENDAWEVGKGVGAAVIFDLALENLMSKKGGNHRGGGGGRGEDILTGVIDGIHEWTGMHHKPVIMAATGIFLMSATQHREVGKALAYIGTYNAVTSHGHMRRMGAGIHGLGNKDVLAAIESGIQERMEAIKKGDGQEALAEEVGEVEMSGGIENEFDDMFKKAQATM